MNRTVCHMEIQTRVLYRWLRKWSHRAPATAFRFGGLPKLAYSLPEGEIISCSEEFQLKLRQSFEQKQDIESIRKGLDDAFTLIRSLDEYDQTLARSATPEYDVVPIIMLDAMVPGQRYSLIVHYQGCVVVRVRVRVAECKCRG